MQNIAVTNMFIYRVTFLFIMKFLTDSSCSIVRENHWVEILSRQITEKIKPYQIILFTYNNGIATLDDQSNIIHQTLMQNVSTISIDLTNWQYSDSNDFLSSQFFLNPRSRSLYIVKLETTDDQCALDLHQIIDIISALTTKYSRPKCLIIFLRSGGLLDHLLEATFAYAWEKKFLDFSFLVKGNQNFFIHYYNPFYDNYSKEIYNPNTEIFPKKLNNLNGYPLLVPIYIIPTKLTFKKDSNGSVSTVEGAYYPLIKIASQRINFQLKFSIIDTLGVIKIVNAMHEKFKNNELNMTPVPDAYFFFKSKFLKLFLAFDPEKITAVVPVIYITEYYTSWYHLFQVFSISLIIMCFIYIFNQLQNEEYFELYNIFRLILSTPLNKIPRKIYNKMILFTISITSLTLSNILFSHIANAITIQDEVSYDTFEDLDKSQLKPCTSKFLFERFQRYSDNKYINNIEKKLNVINNTPICLKSIRNGERFMCIGNDWYLKNEIRKNYLLKNGELKMKIAKPVFRRERLTYTFENASPYIEKFEEIFKGIIESGLWQAWDDLRELYTDHPHTNRRDISKSISLRHLQILLECGYSSAIIVFIIELLIDKILSFYKKNYSWKTRVFEFTH